MKGKPVGGKLPHVMSESASVVGEPLAVADQRGTKP